MNAQIDVRHALASIRAPTLIIHRSSDVRVKIAGGRYLAQKIPGAVFDEVPGRDHPIWTGDIDKVVDKIEEFLTGERATPSHNRVLATLVVARLTAARSTFGADRLWAERAERFRAAAAELISRYGGRPIAAGVDIAARFDGTVRAVRCAMAMREEALPMQLRIASAVHTGEIEVRDDLSSELTLNVTQRIAARAASGEIVVSGIVKDVVAGSGLHFVAHGNEPIDGMDAALPLFAVMVEEHLEPHSRTAGAAHGLDALSAREREVLAHVADGLSNAAIAEALRLSEHTVKRHVANILLKLDLPTRAAAAALIGRKRPP